MSVSDFIQLIFDMYGQLLAYALPVAFVIGACNLIFNIVCSAAFGGKLHIGGVK